MRVDSGDKGSCRNAGHLHFTRCFCCVRTKGSQLLNTRTQNERERERTIQRRVEILLADVKGVDLYLI